LIISIMPEYVGDLGDCCRVFSTDGEKLYKKRIQNVIRELYRERFIDFESVKRFVAELLNQKNLNPYYIGTKEILIPVKVRKPKVLKDSTYGYINVFEISSIMDKQINLRGNQKVSYFDTKRIISRRIKMAKIIEERFPRDINCYVPKNFYDSGITCLIDFMFKEIGNIKMMLEKYMKPSFGV
jgi:hypothetical protein